AHPPVAAVAKAAKVAAAVSEGATAAHGATTEARAVAAIVVRVATDRSRWKFRFQPKRPGPWPGRFSCAGDTSIPQGRMLQQSFLLPLRSLRCLRSLTRIWHLILISSPADRREDGAEI